MAAYVIGHIRVKDERSWERYRAQVGATITAHGGDVVTRGKSVRVLNGQSIGDNVVILRFADIAAANHWHDSPSYQALVALRDQGADVTLTLYEE
jgi:uncharacterized protein (DUF1330 family)